MVEIRIFRDSRDRLSSFFATGHAGWAEHGKDIVCAAVSVALQSADLGLTEVAIVPVVKKQTKNTWRLAWPEDVRDDPAVRAIVGTAARAVETLALQYPKKVRVIRELEKLDG